MANKYRTLLNVSLFTFLGLLFCLLAENYFHLPIFGSGYFFTTISYLFSALIFNIIGFALLAVNKSLGRRMADNNLSKKIIIPIYTAIFSGLFLSNWLFISFAKILAGFEHPFSMQINGWMVCLVLWFIETSVIGLLFVYNYMTYLMQLQKDTMILRQEYDRAKYQALQEQLSPHFLFNSLNILVSQIEFNPQKAITYTCKLSEVYRYVLSVKDRKSSMIKEELGFLKSYIYLQQTRFDFPLNFVNRLNPESLDLSIPTLTLQILAENIFKHNVILPDSPMTIEIGIENGYLYVSNSIFPKTCINSTGIGLSNLSKRSLMLSGSQIIIEKTDKFTVKVPVIYE